jgi:hypothetical protein
MSRLTTSPYRRNSFLNDLVSKTRRNLLSFIEKWEKKTAIKNETQFALSRKWGKKTCDQKRDAICFKSLTLCICKKGLKRKLRV